MRFLYLVIMLGILLSCAAEVADKATPDVATLQAMIRTNRSLVLVDVRISEQYGKGHIPAAINIPLPSIQEKPGIVPRGNPLILYCNKGKMSGKAQAALRKAGYTNILNFGGIGRWKGKLATGPAPGVLE